MKKDIERVYLIDRYLKGELTGLTLDEFKSRLKSEPDFAAEVETQKAIIEGIKLARKEELLDLLRGQKTLSSISHKTQVIEQERVSEISEHQNETVNSNGNETTEVYRMKPNYNNWFYAAVAVLLTPFIFYFVFIYFIKDNSEPLSNNENSTEQTTFADTNNSTEEQKEIVKQNQTTLPSDTTSSSNNIAINTEDSIVIKKDKKIDESTISIANFQSINSVNNEESNNVSNQHRENSLGVNAIKKLNNTTLKIEYWESAVNFNGYKLDGNNLKVFGIKPDDKVSFKFLDDKLYIKKKENYYKLEPSGEFEHYTKEVNREIIKILDSN